MITLYGIKSCDTVRKALKYLDKSGKNYNYHDFRVAGLEQAKLGRWINILGWEKLLNTRSTSWRQLTEQQRQNISESSAMGLMLDNPTLIKRPILERTEQLIVGFKETEYQQLLGS